MPPPNSETDEHAVLERVASASANAPNIRRSEGFEATCLQDESVTRESLEPATNFASRNVGYPDPLADLYASGERVERSRRFLC